MIDKTEQSEEESRRRKRALAKSGSKRDGHQAESKNKREKLMQEVTKMKQQHEKQKKESKNETKQKSPPAKSERKDVATQTQRKAKGSAESTKSQRKSKGSAESMKSQRKAKGSAESTKSQRKVKGLEESVKSMKQTVGGGKGRRSRRQRKKGNSETVTVTIETSSMQTETSSLQTSSELSKETGKSKEQASKPKSEVSKQSLEKECEGDLEDQVYYHGFRPRKDVKGLLNEPGDFLVRATDSRHKPEIVISVINDKHELINLTIKNESDKWQLGVLRKSNKNIPRFTKIQELVNYYKVHKLPGRARLRRGIPRPSWLIKHENVVFDRGKDLIGTGNFCHVFKGMYYRTAQEKYVVAIKMSHEGHGSDKDFEETKGARDSMLAEAHMMSYYVHRHIVELYGVACDHPPVLIVMEYCPGGNLELHLLEEKEKITVGERIVYALELYGVACDHPPVLIVMEYCPRRKFGVTPFRGKRKDNSRRTNRLCSRGMPWNGIPTPEELRSPGFSCKKLPDFFERYI
ncbi:SH2 domain protein [Oesophagostomum dentatum]|uniref:Tyrosine-protein kinase n=1 Tax=Oesophagostomum dentatum TaxID=61180 RepID=A0A0B1SYB5_OESDE|nr:SH2 domain protein [Oesophagostomum dentatum]